MLLIQFAESQNFRGGFAQTRHQDILFRLIQLRALLDHVFDDSLPRSLRPAEPRFFIALHLDLFTYPGHVMT